MIIMKFGRRMKQMDDREKMKQEILAEIKKEYQLIPKKDKPFYVTDIIEKYEKQIFDRLQIENNYSNRQTLGNVLRKVVAMHFGIFRLKDLNPEQRNAYRNELENFINKYILFDKGKTDSTCSFN